MRFESPATLEDAIHLLANAKGTARVLAGGTDVLVQMRLGLVTPDLVVDIKGIPGMRDITPVDGGYRIGAAVTGAEMGEHAGLKALWPGVVEAMELVGSTQVHGRATMAGNLCNASPAADSVPAMIAADAVATIEGPLGLRLLPVAEVPAGPGKTTLTKGEIITSIFLPARPKHSGDAYLRFIPRTEMDIAVSSAGVSLSLGPNGMVEFARVAIGAVAPTARLVEEAGAALVGTQLDAATLDRMMAAVRAACDPIDDKRGTAEFRTKTAAVMAKRAAKTAFARAGGKS